MRLAPVAPVAPNDEPEVTAPPGLPPAIWTPRMSDKIDAMRRIAGLATTGGGLVAMTNQGELLGVLNCGAADG